MSDLISRSELIKAMNESKKQPTSDENIEGYCEGWNDLADIINKQPTAYDISKVVAELKKNKVSNVDLYDENNESWNDDIVSFDTTINIVRKGGVE